MRLFGGLLPATCLCCVSGASFFLRSFFVGIRGARISVSKLGSAPADKIFVKFQVHLIPSAS